MTISTVFPATTAAAVTTFSTGASPAEHGVLGWFLHLPDLGVVSTILPVTTRLGMPMFAGDFDLGGYLRHPKYLESTVGHREFLAFGDIAQSAYSRAGTSWTRTGSFRTLAGLERHVKAFIRKKGQGLAYVYWPEYDTRCHEHGTKHPATMSHLDEIDTTLARLARAVQGTDTVLLVVADHGLVDTRGNEAVDLSAIEGFYDCLATAPSGDARQVSCFVRPRHEKTFLALVREHLSRAAVCLEGETLIRAGVFGPGKLHPSLRRRLGDYVLLAKGSHAFSYPLADWKAHANIGNHGGMSREEMLVPLYVIE